jgi:hypothetical protein
MALNDKPCQECRNYDVIRHGANGKANRGRCAMRSVYPHVEQPGQHFPDNVKRAEPGALAQPFIVVGADVQSGCSYFRNK